MADFLRQLGILTGCALVVWALSRILGCNACILGISRPKRSIAFAAAAAVVTFGITFAILIVHHARHGADGHDPMMGKLWTQMLVPVIDIVPGAIAMFLLREPPASAGFTRRCLWQAVVVGAVLSVAAFYLTPGGFWHRIARINASKSELLLFFAFVGFGEEFLFRGFLQNRLIAWLGRWWGLAAASAIMALAHVPHRLLIEGFGPWQSFVEAARLLPGSLLLGWTMLRLQNLVAPAMMHAFLDWSVSI